MILTDGMISTALKLRDASPWQVIVETDLFAVKLSSGEIGYCCVMGTEGEHFALALYIGRQGFSSYLRSLDISNCSSYEEFMELAMTIDCINCDFMAAKDVDDDAKKRIKEYAAAHGLKIRRPKGWPDFVRRRPYKPENPVTSLDDAQSITEALLAALEVVDAVKSGRATGFKHNGVYPTRRGGMRVPLLTPTAEGNYEWTSTKLPPYEELEADPAVDYHNDIIAFKVRNLPKRRNIIARAVYLPFPVKGNALESASYPMLLLLMDADSGQLLVPLRLEDTEKGWLEGLDELGNIMCNTFKSKPSTLTVDSIKTIGLLHSFCNKCGIDFHVSNKRLEDLDEAYAMFLNPFGI